LTAKSLIRNFAPERDAILTSLCI